MTSCGGISTLLIGPHIYFICTNNLIYVGETQKHPVARWSEHLKPEGSFRLAAARRGFVEMDPRHPISFYAYRIEKLSDIFPLVQLRQATQAVEHEIHIILRASPSLLGRGIQLISDTEKTAPRLFTQWQAAQLIAENAVLSLRAALQAEIS